ncbi:MAG: DMT family transporter [Candidatus Eisenbacteria bacterium]
MSRSFRLAMMWLLAAEACYAVMRVTARLSASASTLPWAEIAAVRFLVGSLVPLGSALVRRAPLRVVDAKNAWLRSLFGTGGALALFYALGTHALSVGDATTLYSTAPLWVAVLSGPVLGERPGWVVGVAVCAGFAGVATLLHAGFRSVGPTGLIVLAGAVSYALAIFRVRRLSSRESSEAIGFHMSITAGVIMLLIALPHWQAIPAAAVLPLGLSALAGGVGQTIIARAYAHEPASKLAAFNYSGVVFTYLLEVALFRRVPEWHQVLGALIIIAAGVLVSVAAARRVGAVPAAQPAE